MPKAIFEKPFNYSSRQRNACWSIKASPEPQSVVQELYDAALAAGVAKPAPKGRKKQTDENAG